MNDIQRLQEDIEAYLLNSEADLTNADECPIQYAAIARVRPRDAGEAAGIQTKLQQVLSGLQGRGGRKGISVIIGMPEISQVEPNVRALTGGMTLVIEVHENIMVNMVSGGTGKGCEEFAFAVGELLNHQPFGLWSPMRVKSILPAPEAVLNQKVVYNVTLETDLRRPLKPKVAVPNVTVHEDGHISATCATLDAVMYYTLDGSLPGPVTPTAIVFDILTGLTLTTGTWLLRVAAWKPGMAGSVVVDKTVTVP